MERFLVDVKGWRGSAAAGDGSWGGGDISRVIPLGLWVGYVSAPPVRAPPVRAAEPIQVKLGVGYGSAEIDYIVVFRGW